MSEYRGMVGSDALASDERFAFGAWQRVPFEERRLSNHRQYRLQDDEFIRDGRAPSGRPVRQRAHIRHHQGNPLVTERDPQAFDPDPCIVMARASCVYLD